MITRTCACLLSSWVLTALFPALAIAQEDGDATQEAIADIDDAPKPAKPTGLLPIPEFGGSFKDRDFLTVRRDTRRLSESSECQGVLR